VAGKSVKLANGTLQVASERVSLLEYRIHDKDSQAFTVTHLAVDDIVLGKPWLTAYNLDIDWQAIVVSVQRHGVDYILPPIVVDPEDVSLISAMQAVKAVDRGATAFVAVLMEVQSGPEPPPPDPFDAAVEILPLPAFPGKSGTQVRQVLLKHRGVFSKVIGLPPIRGHEHEILLQSGAKAPFGPIYQLSPLELEECKKQLTELIEKGFIQPNNHRMVRPSLLCAERMAICACVLIIER
jgi:hypothetical protein